MIKDVLMVLKMINKLTKSKSNFAKNKILIKKNIKNNREVLSQMLPDYKIVY